MRTSWRLAAIAAMSAAVVAAAEPSFAQSLVERLFGYGGSRTSEYRDRRPGGYGWRPDRFYDDYTYWEQDYTTYRTLCVRLCDGFYFPISHGVRRGRLYHDNRTCRRRCDGEARLYYYPTDGGSVETMVDLAGRSYADLPNAFRYRKSLVAGCTCRPEPWSAPELARHQGYKAQAAQSVAEAEVEDMRRQAYARAGSEDLDDDYEPPRSYGSGREAIERVPHTPWTRSRYGWQQY